MTGSGNIIEIQGTAEGKAFTKDQMSVLINLAEKGIEQLMTIQNQALGLV